MVYEVDLLKLVGLGLGIGWVKRVLRGHQPSVLQELFMKWIRDKFSLFIVLKVYLVGYQGSHCLKILILLILSWMLVDLLKTISGGSLKTQFNYALFSMRYQFSSKADMMSVSKIKPMYLVVKTTGILIRSSFWLVSSRICCLFSCDMDHCMSETKSS